MSTQRGARVLLEPYYVPGNEIDVFERYANANVVVVLFSDWDRYGFTSRLQKCYYDASSEHDSDASIVVLDPTTLVQYDVSPKPTRIVITIDPHRLWRTVLGLGSTDFDKDDDMGPFPCEQPERASAFYALLDASEQCVVVEWQERVGVETFGALLVRALNARRESRAT